MSDFCSRGRSGGRAQDGRGGRGIATDLPLRGGPSSGRAVEATPEVEEGPEVTPEVTPAVEAVSVRVPREVAETLAPEFNTYASFPSSRRVC